jgi:predicted O-linked N-acetylglucosamine transferase (SPINDLY family)
VAAAALREVEAALTAGTPARAAELLDAALGTGTPAPAALVVRLAAAFLDSGAMPAAEAWARRGLASYPGDADLWQVLGLTLRRGRRLDEALQALEKVRALAPAKLSALFNIANVHNDRGDGAAAEAALAPLLKVQPRDPELHHILGRARRRQGDLAGADAALARALALEPRFTGAWCDRAMLASERQRHDRALEILAQGLRRLPGEPRLLARRAEVLVRAGRPDEARAGLEAEIAARPDAAWAHHQLARLLVDSDIAAALAHADRAAALAPRNADYVLTRAHASFRASQAGRPELLQAAHDLVQAVSGGRPPPAEQAFVVRAILAQVGAVDEVEAVGDFADLGRYWALNGQHAMLLSQLPLANSPDRRRELLAQHRLWAGPIERRAAAAPAGRRPGPRGGGRLRIGFLSSDLRRHAVGHFAQALFEHYDRDRFELYAYSFRPGPPDEVQARIAGQIAGFRVRPGIAEQAAAQMIADDGLNLLIELGSTTRWNYAQVLAYRPAPVQASWLGYPHSVGLAAIDHLILDPHLAPTAPDLTAETPLLMPHSWLALGRAAFREDPAVDPQAPAARNGCITFGTANNPNKYARPALQAWAQVLAQVPGSRFLFLRPEAAAPAFRRNVARIFAEAGVDPDRLDFDPTVGGHLIRYNRMDVSLDTFPLTGGTTTCESLWMGVPVVSLRGEAVFQRLSHSILTNAGLPDLSVETPEAFVAKAVELAADAPRRAALRRDLRGQLRASPLGRTEAFVQDYFDLAARAAAGAA